MKNLFVLLIAIFFLSALSSCASSPYKKRKGCRGNGSWYGNRNLGHIDQQQKTNQNIYVLAPTTETATNF